MSNYSLAMSNLSRETRIAVTYASAYGTIKARLDSAARYVAMLESDIPGERAFAMQMLTWEMSLPVPDPEAEIDSTESIQTETYPSII